MRLYTYENERSEMIFIKRRSARFPRRFCRAEGVKKIQTNKRDNARETLQVRR